MVKSETLNRAQKLFKDYFEVLEIKGIVHMEKKKILSSFIDLYVGPNLHDLILFCGT